MNENQSRQGSLVETTDCLEAVGVFRGWKNFLSIIVALCLLLLQASFWLVNTGYVKPGESSPSQLSAVAAQDTENITKAPSESSPQQGLPVQPEPVGQTDQPSKEAMSAPPQESKPLFGVTFEHLTWLIRFVNGVLILTAALYALTMLFSLKVSLIGKLGGINHIARAFFLSLVMAVLLLPWQKLFGSTVVGAIYTPDELAKSCAVRPEGIFGMVIHYLRFTGYWALIVLLFVFAQLRSSRWAKAILRRLEVI
jgi:hypothetical protein